MGVRKSFYNITYRYFRAPWDIRPRSELIELIDNGRIQSCRAIDLGYGTGENALYFAKKGFDGKVPIRSLVQ